MFYLLNHKKISDFIFFAAIALCTFTTEGCGKRNIQPTQADVDAAFQFLDGRVSLGPVSDATISAYRLNADGSRGELLDETVSDENGDYHLKISRDSGPIEIVAVGGGI